MPLVEFEVSDSSSSHSGKHKEYNDRYLRAGLTCTRISQRGHHVVYAHSV